MKLLTDISIKSPDTRVKYTDPVMLVGSCFTEHIGDRMEELKFEVLQNPHGILFDPISVCNSLVSYIENKQYQATDLFFHNELWQSWAHHSRFSGIDQDAVLANINSSQDKAHHFLRKASWLVITLGSSFSYRLVDQQDLPVANCHRAPGQWFRKHLCPIEETVTSLDNTLYRLFHYNPDIRVIFTISPVRHLRDGVVENNRSKARLIESVHHLVNKFNRLYYFPAYELVIDVLRDYRFFDIDLAHPNYAATQFVLEKFREYFIDPSAYEPMDMVQQVLTARKHKAFQPQTNAHRQFMQSFHGKALAIKEKYPYLNLEEEINYFASGY